MHYTPVMCAELPCGAVDDGGCGACGVPFVDLDDGGVRAPANGIAVSNTVSMKANASHSACVYVTDMRWFY